MKFSAAILALTFSAAPAFAADWAPAVNPETLSAVAAPVPAAPSKASPRDGANYSGAEELLIKEFGITAITLDIPEAEVIRQDQLHSNTFCFEQGMRLALNDVLENYKNQAAPLAKALKEIGSSGQPSKADIKTARQKVMGLLNNPGSLISLVRPYKFNQPPNGETVEKNWIFFLRLNGNSYWSVVDRSGVKAPYIYSPQ